MQSSSVVKVLYLGVPMSLLMASSVLANGIVDYHQIGWTSLLYELGNNAMPTGSGVQVTQTEAPAGGAYMPDAADIRLLGTTIINMNTANINTGSSAHATGVGDGIYGNTEGLAPGIKTALSYEATDWYNYALNGLNPSAAPKTETSQVLNASWIWGSPSLERLDGMIARDNVLAAVAVNNGTGSLPWGACYAHNVIAVGRSDGQSSSGPTDDGRSKPDIVGANHSTSGSTPEVTGAAAMLIQAAGTNTDAKKVQTLKAILMAGASKSGLTATDTSGTVSPATWTTVGSEPLDRTYGAGLLNVDRSYHILTGGSFLTTDLASINLSLYRVNSGYQLGSLVSSSFSTGASNNVDHIYQQNLPAGRYVIQVTSNKAWDYGLAWDVPTPAPGRVLLGRKFANGSFEDFGGSTNGWTAVHGTVTLQSSASGISASDGAKFVKLANAGTGGYVDSRMDMYDLVSGDNSAGSRFHVSIDAQSAAASAGVNGFDLVGLELIFAASDNTVLATPWVPLTNSHLSTTWTTYAGDIDIDPALVWYKMDVRVYFASYSSVLGTSYAAYADNIQIDQVLAPEPASIVLLGCAAAGTLLLRRSSHAH